MNRKTTGIVAYLTIIGWLIAFIAGDKEGAKFHLNQGLVISIGYIISRIIGRLPFIWWVSYILDIFLLVCVIIGLVGAAQDQEKEAPLIGGIRLLN